MTEPASVFLIGAEDEENLAIRTLAAFLIKHGIKSYVVGYSSANHTRRVLRAVKNRKPEVIAISLAFQCLAYPFFRLVERIRGCGYRGHIIVGGHFPTFEYRNILESQEGIDSVGRFEGEHCLVKLAEALKSGRSLADVPNLVYRTPQGLAENGCIHSFMNLDQMPFPVRNKRAQVRLGERFATLVSSRGCWHSSCVYCCIGAFHRSKQQKFILRDADSVADELAMLYKQKGIRLFQFHDDNFVLPSRDATRERINRLRDAINAKGINLEDIAFLIKARPDTIDNDVAEALAQIGCVGVFLGIENAAESGLNSLIRGVCLSDIQNAVEALRRNNIAVTYNLLIFHPHATQEEIDRNIAFVKAMPMLPFDFGRAEIVAGSPLERLVRQEGKVRGTWPNWDYIMDDEIVQRMFEINQRTFRARDTHYTHLIHALIPLSYHAHALARLHKGAATDLLLHESNELISGANLFLAGCLEQARRLAESDIQEKDLNDLNAVLQDGCSDYRKKSTHLTNKILRLQTAEQVFAFFDIKSEVQQSRMLRRLFGFQGGAIRQNQEQTV